MCHNHRGKKKVLCDCKNRSRDEKEIFITRLRLFFKWREQKNNIFSYDRRLQLHEAGVTMKITWILQRLTTIVEVFLVAIKVKMHFEIFSITVIDERNICKLTARAFNGRCLVHQFASEHGNRILCTGNEKKWWKHRKHFAMKSTKLVCETKPNVFPYALET